MNTFIWMLQVSITVEVSLKPNLATCIHKWSFSARHLVELFKKTFQLQIKALDRNRSLQATWAPKAVPTRPVAGDRDTALFVISKTGFRFESFYWLA